MEGSRADKAQNLQWVQCRHLAAASAEVNEVPAFLQVQGLQVVFKRTPCEVLWGEEIQLSQASS